jgi:hypothetical protein
MQDNEANSLESLASLQEKTPEPSPKAWIKVGAIAAASALVGGLAAAWFYRKTLNTLREAESAGIGTEFGISDNETDTEI